MSSITRLLRLLAPFRWWIALSVVLAFGTIGASVGLMAMSAYLISKAALASGFFDLAVAVTAVRALAIARAALRYAERYLTHLATFRILTRLRVWFYSAVEPLAPARLQRYHSGDLLTRIVADIETLDQFYVRAVVPPLAAVLVTILACGILGIFDPKLGLVLAIFLVVTGVALPLLTRRLSQAPASELVSHRAALYTVVTDEIQGIADLMAFGQEPAYSTRTLGLSRQLAEAQLRVARLRGLSNALATLFASLAGLTVLMMAIPLVSGGAIDGIFLALLPLTAIASFEAVQPLSAALQHLETSQAAARRIFELLDAPPAIVEPVAPLPLPADYSIEFDNVSFCYAPGDPPALDDLSFRLPSGDSMVVSGPSGAGKSTLVHLLARFWEPQAGSVRIGGNDVRSYSSEELRELLGVATQHIHLFNGTIRDNLLLAKGDATDEQISAACRIVQIHDFIASLPLGYDTLVGENGMKLSGGERQRLSLARVILKDTPIVILDEALANLDALTEREVIQALETFRRGRTTLIISHRRVGFEHIDQRIALEHGRIAV